MSLFSYDFFTQSAIAVLLTGLITGIIGSFIVVRRMVFVSGGITHSSFAGLGLGFFMGHNPLFYAIGAAVLSALGVEWLSQKGKVREDSAIAAIWSLGMALGILFVFLTPGYTPSLTGFLFGNILLVTPMELWGLVGYSLLTILLVARYYRPLLYISFDPEFMQVRGLRRSLYQYAMIIWISIGIVLSIRVMGVMMLMSMLTLPQMTMSQFTSSLKHLIIGSSLLSIFTVLTALFGSYYFNLPTGVLSVLLLSVVFLVTKGGIALKSK
ncbi:metal ABC transporter permease [Porphyromonas levii]|uniref:metal ABC transporter permease n=1 Tax=Porphyromonas levii TaxID=28114 RepID=UPI00036892E9|nr:metal ABC transporter permease [Porphyromonas levii]